MVNDLKDVIPVDDFFRSSNVATDFFKRKDRSKACDISDVVGIRTISWNLSGTLLGCGSDNRGVSTCTLDPHSCRIKETASSFDHDDAVEGVEFSKHSDVTMASCSSDKTVRLWDMRIPLKSHSCIPTKDSNLFLSWTNNGHYLILGDKSDTINLIDTRINKIVESVAFKEEINEFACNSNSELLFISTDHGKLEIFSIPKLKRIRTIQTHPQLSTCQSIAISPDERYISIGGSDACCSIWDLRDMICTKTLTRLDYPIRTISYSHCGNLIATGSEDRVIDISWAPTGEKITEVPIQSECFEVAWHPRLYLLAYATGIESVLRDRDRNDQVTLKIFGYSG